MSGRPNSCIVVLCLWTVFWVIILLAAFAIVHLFKLL